MILIIRRKGSQSKKLAMEKKLKKIILFLLIIFFLILVPLTIFYANGYRINFSTGEIVKLGGLYLKIEPPSARVYLDNVLIKKTNLFFNSVFLNNLLPKKWFIRIEKENYHTWEKNLKIEESLVTEAKNIILFPKNINFEHKDQNIKNFFFSPSGRSVILKKIEKDGWRLEIIDNVELKKTEFISEKELSPFFKSDSKLKKARTSISLGEIIWSFDEKKIIFEAEYGNQKRIFAFDLLLNKLSLLAQESFWNDVKFNPQNSDEIIFIENQKEKSGLVRMLISDEKMKKTPLLKNNESLENNFLTFSFSNGNIVFLDQKGFLYRGEIKNEKISILEILNLKPLETKNKNYKIFSLAHSRFLILENDTLYYINPKNHLISLISEGVKNILPDPENKKILILKEKELIIFYLEAEYQQPARLELDSFLIYSSQQEIKDAFWINPHYIIFSEKDGIFITEIDNRDLLNKYKISELKDSRIFWFGAKKILFALSEDNFYSNGEILK